MQDQDQRDLRLRLLAQLLTLPADQLPEVERVFMRGASLLTPSLPAPAVPRPDWPHAPLHRLGDHGTYLVTTGTYQREHYFRNPDRVDYLQSLLLSLAKEMGWELEAWAVFSNHYHFVARAPAGPNNLPAFLKQLHRQTSAHVNQLDGCSGRQVWHNYWETRLTFEKSYLARLNYVHHNAVKHGLVSVARLYPWCSADWFERSASPAQVRTITSFKIDKVHVEDDYHPI